MALIILEGLDRTGKSSVAHMFEQNGYELIHISAPPKGTSPDEYIGEWVDLLTLETRMRYAFIHTYKPVLDDAPYRSFDTMEDYRR